MTFLISHLIFPPGLISHNKLSFILDYIASWPKGSSQIVLVHIMLCDC